MLDTLMADKTTTMKQAQKYLAKGQIDKAIAEWEKLIYESPDGNAYNIVGDLYLKKNDKKNAIDSYQKAANFFRHEGFSLKALALYKKVLNINPSETDSLHSLGELSEEKGLTTDAIKYYLATADSLVKSGKKEQVLDIYEKVLSLSPSNIPLRIKVAEIFLKEGLKSDASKQYIEVARLYDEKGDVPRSKEFYQKVLDLQPLNRDAAVGISYLYEKTGDMQNAVDHIKEATVLFPEDVEVLLRCAELSLLGGDTDSARESLFRITEKDPANIRARRFLGELYLQEGFREKAWAEYLPVLDQMILDEKYQDAIRLLDSFKDLDPIETGKRLVSLYRQLGENVKVAAEQKSLADAVRMKGMEGDAVSLYREALEINPDNAELRSIVAEIDAQIEKDEEVVLLDETEETYNGAPESGEEAVQTAAGGRDEKQDMSVRGGKTVDEVFTEADIFARYGLLGEAKRLLEGLKLAEPNNIDLHIRLKSLYVESKERELAVTECIILKKLYQSAGDSAAAEEIMKEAVEIYPDDPRLVDRAAQSLLEPTSFAETRGEGMGTDAPDRADYEEEIAEAEFYARQGLIQEAQKILERLKGIFPDDAEISEKLAGLGQGTEIPVSDDLAEPDVPSEEPYEIEDETLEASVGEMEFQQKDSGENGEKPGDEEYEDLMLTDKDLMEAEEVPEPALDSDVLEIFDEFKKGLEKELGDEDSETHYNLGIAYKEMGLIDDAIKAFQTARNDPKRFMQSLTMLGACYKDKGMHSLAIDVLKTALEKIDSTDESAWAIKYDLGEAYEKNGNLKEALHLFTGVFGWNARFRNVADKVNEVKDRLAKGAPQEKPKERKDRVSYL